MPRLTAVCKAPLPKILRNYIFVAIHPEPKLGFDRLYMVKLKSAYRPKINM